MAQHDKHHDKHHHGGGGGAATADGGGGGGDERDRGRGLKPFADGTSDFPTPIQGLGSTLASTANGGNTSVLTPVPKTGFVGAFKHAVSGTVTVGTAGTQYQVPLHRLMANYSIQNSLQYPYRSLNYDDVWFWANIGSSCQSSPDRIYGSLTAVQPNVTGTGAKNYAYTFTDWVALNDGQNFSRYLLSALTNSNDLTIAITWLQIANISYIEGNTAVYSAYTASDAVSCVYNTVPNPDEWYWPDTSKVQQCLGDPSWQQLQASAANDINLTPISGPDFLGIGIQVVWNTTAAGWLVDPLIPGSSGITQVGLYVGGRIPLKIWSLQDLLRDYEDRFGRVPAYGFLYVDLCTDVGLPNYMSNIMRKALATTKYAQMTLEVVTNGNQTAGTGAKINVFKRTQQQYAGNAAIS